MWHLWANKKKTGKRKRIGVPGSMFLRASFSSSIWACWARRFSLFSLSRSTSLTTLLRRRSAVWDSSTNKPALGLAAGPSHTYLGRGWTDPLPLTTAPPPFTTPPLHLPLTTAPHPSPPPPTPPHRRPYSTQESVKLANPYFAFSSTRKNPRNPYSIHQFTHFVCIHIQCLFRYINSVTSFCLLINNWFATLFDKSYFFKCSQLLMTETSLVSG